MTESPQRPGCLRVGCCSCLVLFGLLVGGLAFMAAMQFRFDRGPGSPQSAEVRRELPTLPELQALVASGEVGDQGAALEIGARRYDSFAELVAAVGGGSSVVTVELDLDIGSFEIYRAEPGQGVVIDADYDERAFRFSEEYRETADGGVVRITANARGGFLGMAVRGAGGRPRNQVRIGLPPDVPLELVGEIGLGDAELDLGGLLLRAVDLDLGTGEHRIDFGEPLLAPMERLELRKGIGEVFVRHVGNASPAFVRIESKIGDTTVDLRGAWRTDAEVELMNRIGQLYVESPDTARVVMGGGGAMIGERSIDVPDLDLPEDAPTIRLSVHGSIGEVRVD